MASSAPTGYAVGRIALAEIALLVLDDGQLADPIAERCVLEAALGEPIADERRPGVGVAQRRPRPRPMGP